ncbi:hypothetical protein D6810_00010 [Candidatus Dojkabacteria bacterium]|uniref:Uncharacterized protein n=1 Tax=Candidatus Dojkabacteria bacterium TaxID=2099670 RepID=A0A3M0Z0B1_9BACT|nr:MAG: hypothetical protein D6810_00010 [Candidatus Dojkabacteria bacterium]
MKFSLLVSKFHEFGPIAKLAVFIGFLIAALITTQAIEQILSSRYRPYGFFQSIFANSPNKQTTTLTSSLNKGGQNIGGVFDSGMANLIFEKEKNANINSGFTLTIVNTMDDLSKASSFINVAKSLGKTTVIRFCVNDGSNTNGSNGTPCSKEFAFAGASINENHGIVRFCSQLAQTVGTDSFICTTGPNEASSDYEFKQFGYTSLNLPDIVSKSIQLAKILKGKGIQTSTFSMNVVTEGSPEFTEYTKQLANLDASSIFDYAAINVYDVRQFESFRRYSESNINGNTIKGFFESKGVKILVTETGSLLPDKSAAFETLKKNIELFCTDENVSGVLLFRSSESLFGEGAPFRPYIKDFLGGPDSGGNLRTPQLWNDDQLRELLDSCNVNFLKRESRFFEEPYDISSFLERCTSLNPITNLPNHTSDFCSTIFRSKSGVNDGGALTTEKLIRYRGEKENYIPNLGFGAVLILIWNGDVGKAIDLVRESNRLGYLPIIRFCYLSQPNEPGVGCELTFEIEDQRSFAKICETIYKGTEDVKAQFVCILGPNEPHLEWTSFFNVKNREIGGSINYSTFVEGANKNAEYLQKYRDRMFLAPAIFDVASCKDAPGYLSGSPKIKPELFDYILGNIYSLERLNGGYSQYVEARCTPKLSLKQYVEKNELKFIATEIGPDRPHIKEMKKLYEQDIINYCKDNSIDYFLYFKQVYVTKEEIEEILADQKKEKKEEKVDPYDLGILTIDEILRYSSYCPKDLPLAEFNVNTILYQESKSNKAASVKTERVPQGSVNSTNPSFMKMNCSGDKCTYSGRRTVRINANIKAISSATGNKYFTAVSLPLYNSFVSGEYQVEPLANVSGMAIVNGKNYPIPTLGTFLAQSEIMKYSFVSLTSTITELNINPGMLRENYLMNLQKDKYLKRERQIKNSSVYFGEDFRHVLISPKKVLTDNKFISLRPNKDGLKSDEISAAMFGNEILNYRRYDPLKFDRANFVKEIQGRKIRYYDIPENDVWGPEIVMDDFTGSVRSIDVCWKYARRNLAVDDTDKNIQIFGKPSCNFRPNNVILDAEGKPSRCSLQINPSVQCNVRLGNCNGLSKKAFEACFGFDGMLEGAVYYRTENYLVPDNIEIQGVMDSLYEMYNIINRNLSERGFRLNTGDYIYAAKATVKSSIKDLNRINEIGQSSEPKSLFKSLDPQLSYTKYDPISKSVTSTEEALKYELFENDVPQARARGLYESYKDLEYVIPHLGLGYLFTEMITGYLRDGYLSSVQKPVPQTRITNPFYKVPEICEIDQYLCSVENILAPEISEIFRINPILTCDVYHIQKTFENELAVKNKLKELNLSSNEFFESAIRTIFKFPKQNLRIPCIESIEARSKIGQFEAELCRRGYVIQGLCINKCDPTEVSPGGSVTDSLGYKLSNPSCPVKGGKCRQGPYGNVSHSCKPGVGGSLAFDFIGFQNWELYAPEDGKFYAGDAIDDPRVMKYCIGRTNVTVNELAELNKHKSRSEIERIVANNGGTDSNGNIKNPILYSPGGNLYFQGNSGIKYYFVHIAVSQSQINDLKAQGEIKGGSKIQVKGTPIKIHRNPFGLQVYCMNGPHLHFESSYAGLGKNKKVTDGKKPGDPYRFLVDVLKCPEQLTKCDIDSGPNCSGNKSVASGYQSNPSENAIVSSTESSVCIPEEEKSGDEQDKSNNKCNEFNCGLGSKSNDIFKNSLNCATNTISNNIGRGLSLGRVVDKYGPFWDNEIRGIKGSNTNTSMPFGYRLIVDFYDKYKPPGTPGGRSCADAPPEKVRQSDIGLTPDQLKKITEKDFASWTYKNPEGKQAYDYYRGALDKCGLGNNVRWTKESSSFGSFEGLSRNEGISDENLKSQLRRLVDELVRKDVNYRGIAYLKNVPKEKILAVLVESYKKNVNPFLVMGVWATESWFGQFQEINFKSKEKSCNFF